MNNKHSFLVVCLISLTIAPSCKRKKIVLPVIGDEKTTLEFSTNPLKIEKETSSVLKF